MLRTLPQGTRRGASPSLCRASTQHGQRHSAWTLTLGGSFPSLVRSSARKWPGSAIISCHPQGRRAGEAEVGGRCHICQSAQHMGLCMLASSCSSGEIKAGSTSRQHPASTSPAPGQHISTSDVSAGLLPNYRVGDWSFTSLTDAASFRTFEKSQLVAIRKEAPEPRSHVALPLPRPTDAASWAAESSSCTEREQHQQQQEHGLAEFDNCCCVPGRRALATPCFESHALDCPPLWL